MTAGGYCRAVGLTVGIGLGYALLRTYLFDLAAVALAMSLVAGMVIGELVSPRPVRGRGVASLRPRRLRDDVPGGTVLVIVLLGAGMQALTLFRMPPPPSHEIEYFGTAAPVSLWSTWVVLAAAAGLAALSVWLVVRSAQTGVDEAERAADEAWRQAAVRRIVNGCAALYALVFTALGFWYADSQMDWRGGGSPPYGFALALLSGLGLVLLVRYAGALVFAEPERAVTPAAVAPDAVSP